MISVTGTGLSRARLGDHFSTYSRFAFRAFLDRNDRPFRTFRASTRAVYPSSESPEMRPGSGTSFSSPQSSSWMQVPSRRSTISEARVQASTASRMPRVIRARPPSSSRRSVSMARMTHLSGDHSQVGWPPPSYLPYHFSRTTKPLSQGNFDRTSVSRRALFTYPS